MTQSTTSTEFLREALDEDGDAVTAQSVLGRLPEHFTPREPRDVLASSELDSPPATRPWGTARAHPQQGRQQLRTDLHEHERPVGAGGLPDR